MRNIKWLVAAALAVSVTGCVEMDGYPTTSYGGGYPSGYGYSNGYYAQPTYSAADLLSADPLRAGPGGAAGAAALSPSRQGRRWRPPRLGQERALALLVGPR